MIYMNIDETPFGYQLNMMRNGGKITNDGVDPALSYHKTIGHAKKTAKAIIGAMMRLEMTGQTDLRVSGAILIDGKPA